MTPLRQRMLDELSRRNYSQSTIDVYVRAVAAYALHFRRSPADLGADDVLTFQLHLRDVAKVSWSTYNVTTAALRFLYGVVLARPGVVLEIPYARRPRRVPIVLSQNEMRRLIDAADKIRDRALIMVAYAAGLRVSEVVNLRVEDIDSDRMLIHVRQGKGNKDRLVPLSPALLDVLRRLWRTFKPTTWLFPGEDGERPLHQHTVRNIVRDAAKRAKIKKRVSPHTLRHTFATHLLETGIDVRTVQALLGHARLSSTMHYHHVVRQLVTASTSPLDLLT